MGGEISVEQTLQVLYVPYGREKLDSEIQEVFGEEQKLPDGQEKRINYTEYLRRVNARLAKIRNAKKTETGGGNHPKAVESVFSDISDYSPFSTKACAHRELVSYGLFYPYHDHCRSEGTDGDIEKSHYM